MNCYREMQMKIWKTLTRGRICTKMDIRNHLFCRWTLNIGQKRRRGIVQKESMTERDLSGGRVLCGSFGTYLGALHESVA